MRAVLYLVAAVIFAGARAEAQEFLSPGAFNGSVQRGEGACYGLSTMPGSR